MPKTPPEVVWSDHAVSRGAERFGDCTQLTFPDEIIQAVACCKQVGESFRVGQAGVLYCCVLASETQVVVKTVHGTTKEHMDRSTGHSYGVATSSYRGPLRRRYSAREPGARAGNKFNCGPVCLPCRNYFDYD